MIRKVKNSCAMYCNSALQSMNEIWNAWILIGLIKYLGVDQAKALSKLLDSESSSEDEEKKKSDDEGDDEDEAGNKKKKKKTDDNQEEGSTKEDKTEEGEDEKAKKAEKRKALVDNLLDPNAAGPSKKSRMDSFAPSAGTLFTVSIYY